MLAGLAGGVVFSGVASRPFRCDGIISIAGSEAGVSWFIPDARLLAPPALAIAPAKGKGEEGAASPDEHMGKQLGACVMAVVDQIGCMLWW